ncbi:MAG: hypothetical protein AAGN82_29810 [Myxococcota bacterium]
MRSHHALGVTVLLVASGCTGSDGDLASSTAGGAPAGGGGTFSTSTTRGGAGGEAGTGGQAPTTMETSVTQYEITWSFDAAYPVGQFITGDWWVVGPVTIASVSPEPTADRNGSMVDPVNAQAYDSRAGKHDGTKGASFPLLLEPGHSLVSSVSHPEQSECTQGSAPGWRTYDGGCQRGPIATQAVLTVVDAVPLASSFRPPYSGTDKPMHRADRIDWGMLPALTAPADAPDPAAILRHMERPWIDHLNSWQMQHGCATQNMYCYGREVGDIVAQTAVFVLLDTSAQREVARNLVQLGIDNYGVLRAGGGWGVDGGHFNGRKWPIVFAGGLLGDATMASPGLDIGNEDQMTYVGSEGNALWGRSCDSCYFGNSCGYSSSCSNGAKDCRDPAGVVDGCSDYRNCCTSHTWVGEALAARLLGLEEAWGHPPFFDYVDRWMGGDVPGGGGTSASFITELWSTAQP